MNAATFDFCPVLAQIIQNGSTTGRSGRTLENRNGLSTQNNLLTLRKLHLHLRPARTLEIGFAFAGSALVFTSTHQALGQPACQQHTALDPFQAETWDDAGLLAIDRAGLRPYLDFRPAFSRGELPRMAAAGEKYGLVYIDGSHLFEDVFVDFYHVCDLLTEGGVVTFDDCRMADVRKVLRFIRANLKASFVEMDLAPYRTDAGQSMKYRLARLVGQTQMTAFRRIGPPRRKWNAPFTDF